MVDLPQFIFLISDVHKKYLRRSKKEQGSSSTRAYLLFSDDVKAAKVPKSENTDQPVVPNKDDQPVADSARPIEFQYLRFEVEKAKTVEGFVHIRTCYNNKYLVRESKDSDLIVAEASEPEEDMSKWSCTVFKPVFLDAEEGDKSAKKMLLLHLGEHHLRTCSLNGQIHLSVGASNLESNSSASVLTVADAGSVAILPEYVAFIGHNDKYLVADGLIYLGATDIGARGVAQRISYSNSTSEIAIMDHASRYYWFDLGVVVPAASQIGANLFSPIKVGNYIALRGKSIIQGGREAFASTTPSSDGSPYPDYLVVTSSTITETAMLRVAEPVRVREIIDATYHLEDSRVYDTSSIEKFVDSRSNFTEVEQNGSIQVEYKVAQTTSWTNNTTVNVGINASWSAGIPFVGTLGVDISYDHTQSWELGGQTTTEKTVTYLQAITLPPKTKVTVIVLAMRSFCDVPFSCKVRDLMTFGELREYDLTDGLFSGCNEYQFNTQIHSESL